MEAQLRLGGAKGGFVSKTEEAALASGYRFLWRLQASGRLLTDRPIDMEAIGEGGRAFLLRETDCETLEALAQRLQVLTVEITAIVDRCLAGEG